MSEIGILVIEGANAGSPHFYRWDLPRSAHRDGAKPMRRS
jgi:hypothetical protein